MGTNCAPLVADLFLFCYERDFMKSFSPENQADIIEAFNSTSRYIDDLLNIDHIYFEQMVNRIYPAKLQRCVDKNNCIQYKITIHWVFISNIKSINHIDRDLYIF